MIIAVGQEIVIAGEGGVLFEALMRDVSDGNLCKLDEASRYARYGH